MKKLLISITAIFLCSQGVFANQYNTFGSSGQIKFAAEKQQIQQETIFNQPVIEEVETSRVDKIPASQKIVTKDLKKKYKKITASDKLIEAVELLKNSAGNFSYDSIHGNNKSCAPIKIRFVNFSKDTKHKDKDAYGEFSGSKYQINVNEKFQNVPAAALAPLIAREALVSKEKTDSDFEAAKQLQVAIWTQMCENNPTLRTIQNPLVQIQNELKAGGNIDEYGAFLNSAPPPKSKNSEPPKAITRSFRQGAPIQADFDVKKQAAGAKKDAEILSYDSKGLLKKYKKVTKEDRIIEALEMLEGTIGKFSHDAILGKNLTHRAMSIKFKNLSEINPQYGTFDALGWRQAGKLNIYINHKHVDAPAAAIAAILAHEALHQDEFDSLNEETYAWTLEAAVWTQLCDKHPNVDEITHPLVSRENMLKKLFEKGDYSNKYIKKSVFSNPSYSKLPARSPGFEDDL